MELLRAPIELEQLEELRSRGTFFWLDLDEPTPEDIQAIGQALGWHALAVEDTQEFCQRPKVDTYGNHLLLVYYGARLEHHLPEPVEVHMHISSDCVVTVHRHPCPRFAEMRKRLEQRPPDDEHRVIHHVIDALTDSVLDVLEVVAGIVDSHEARVYGHPRARDRDEMAMLRQALGRLRRVMAVQRQVFDRTVEQVAALRGLDETLTPYYRDVADHLARAIDEIEVAREALLGTLATYTNEVQERLTIVATIFLPLTMITGFFGMNFNWMINHIGSAGTFFGLGVGGMLLAGAGIWAWLIRSGLYQRPHRSPPDAEADS